MKERCASCSVAKFTILLPNDSFHDDRLHTTRICNNVWISANDAISIHNSIGRSSKFKFDWNGDDDDSVVK